MSEKMNMDNEDIDELPSITVTFSGLDLKFFSMPSATELASQRAREEQCEQELLRMHEDFASERGSPQVEYHTILRSESSESDSEIMLTTAETALQVRSTEVDVDMPRLQALLIPLRPHLPDTAFFDAYCEGLRVCSDEYAFLQNLLLKIAGMLICPIGETEVWDSSEVVCLGAWLCAALISRDAHGVRLQISRAAHLLIDNIATHSQVLELTAVLLKGVKEIRMRFEMADALRTGGAHAEEIAKTLLQAIVNGLLGDDAFIDEDCEKAGRLWRRLCPDEQYIALVALGRVNATASRTVERLIETLANAVSVAHRRDPDSLKVLLAASKLAVLFHLKK